MEILKTRYPKKFADRLTVRPLEAADEKALASFFQRMPVEERQLFKDDVTKASTIRSWIKHLDYGNILPLLAFDGGRLVGDATIHRDRRGWSRHVAKIRISLDPDFRRRGLARQLIREIVELSSPLRIAILHAEILDVQQGARALFGDLGFVQVATLPQHAIDLSGRVHDVLVYAHTVTPPERLAPEATPPEDNIDLGGGA